MPDINMTGAGTIKREDMGTFFNKVVLEIDTAAEMKNLKSKIIEDLIIEYKIYKDEIENIENGFCFIGNSDLYRSMKIEFISKESGVGEIIVSGDYIKDVLEVFHIVQKAYKKRKFAVHISHCCVKHGCKYSEPDCPVVNGEVQQTHVCEDCSNEGIDKVEELLQKKDMNKLQEIFKQHENKTGENNEVLLNKLVKLIKYEYPYQYKEDDDQ